MVSRRNLLQYFKKPFPPGGGFSPYRFPGLAVHIPILLASVYLGYTLCGWNLYLWPLMLIYLLIGLYGGRDWAIAAHYNPLIIVLAWVVFIVGLRYFPRLANYMARDGLRSLLIPLGVTAAFLLLFAWQVRRSLDWFRGEADAPRDRSPSGGPSAM